MNRLKDFFYYSRTERNGIITLIFILCLFLLLPYTYSYFSTKTLFNFKPWQVDIAAFEAGLSQKALEKKRTSKWKQKSFGDKKGATVVLQPQVFDPNTASSLDLEAMGLPPKTIKSILNYRAKGGQFKDKESLEKIYTLSPEHYQQLYPFIDLAPRFEKTALEASESRPLPPAFDFDPNTATKESFEALGLANKTIRSILNYKAKGGQFRKTEDFQKIYNLPDSVYQHLKANIKIIPQPKYSAKKNYPPKVYRKIDINTAKVEDFEQFRGIGASYAKRILKMRENLGGFWQVAQVGELYKLPDSTFQAMRPYLECDPVPLHKININTATVDELKAHPYLRWYHAKAIVHYRETEGLWKSVDLVQILTEFDDNKGTFQKIKPYLTID
ncbi:MAG: Unknown protein [uncultured Aureispira sp.]|uniref:Helix-hairpin-helix domain-containing protein n=1 Tax=uncultured Aureispira sp. TaxID=1331704 RepID=A0A6S6S3S0_9BACT|nr:MAG: Unknown protein [uncultured Aureispira sp.]